MVLILLCAVTPGYGESGPLSAVKAGMAADGRSITFQAPGLTEFKGGFSAAIISGGETQKLSSALGTVVGTPERTTEVTPYGTATVTAVTIYFEKEQIDLLFRLGQVPGVSGFQVQAGIRNSGPSSVRLLSLTPVALEGLVEGNPAEWLVTTLDQSAKNGPAVVALNEVQAPFNIHEYGGFYRGDGKGFLFGPVGTPTAYLQASFAHKGDGKIAFEVVADMSGVQVKPGETRWGQQAGVFAEPPRTALPRWAAWVAKTHAARTDKGALSGWNSWSFHGVNITGKDVLAEVEQVLTSKNRLRPAVMEIDKGFTEDDSQPLNTNDKFPEDLAFYAQRIATTGARPGILLNFFGPPGFAALAGKIRSAVQKGFTDIKINNTALTILPEELAVKTLFEVKRDGFSMLREAAGQGPYLLYNESRPDRATVGMVDANRTGAWASRKSVRASMTDVLRSYHLNGCWFAVDPDSYYMGTDIDNVSAITGGWPLVRTWMSMVGLCCGAAITTDPWHWESFRHFLRNVEVMTPPARERTEVLDLCTAPEWPRLLGHVRRAWGDMTVALLWNPGEKERTVTLDFVQAGLDTRRRYAVWSFWDNRYLGVAKGSWTTPALGPSASQHLCFTDLESTPGKPVLIGSSLHIYCGAAEIKHVEGSRGAMGIELTDAGARDGDLFVYSRLPVILKTAVGCNVTGVSQAGENAWKISLADRKCGVPQRIDLNVLLPVTQQAWFWVLIVTVVASLLFGAWRYVAWLQIQREHAIEQDRVRISRDLHDDLGGGLTEIGLLSDLVANSKLAGPETAQKIGRRVRELAGALDEIVWVVNPRHDNPAALVSYFCLFAQEFRGAAGVNCQLEVAEPLPVCVFNTETRHQLFLALKEALNNIVKHARASEVHLRIKADQGRFVISVTDNGCGFSGMPLSGSPDGLQNMRDRLARLGGHCEINSSPGKGVSVVFSVPV